MKAITRFAGVAALICLGSALRTAAGDPLNALTPRERDVLAAMAQGKSNAGIARGLIVSEAAVEKHVTAIFRKLGIGPASTEHRRVHAVLVYLHDHAGGH